MLGWILAISILNFSAIVGIASMVLWSHIEVLREIQAVRTILRAERAERIHQLRELRADIEG